MGWEDDLLDKTKPESVRQQENAEEDENKRQEFIRRTIDKFQELKHRAQAFQTDVTRNHVLLKFRFTSGYEFGLERTGRTEFVCKCNPQERRITFNSGAGADVVVMGWQQEDFVYQSATDNKRHQVVDFETLMGKHVKTLL